MASSRRDLRIAGRGEGGGRRDAELGVFVNTVIQFVIVAFAIFMVVRSINRLRRQEAPPPAETPRQEILLAEIRDLLKSRG